jgi:hypothetical protein
MSMLCVSNIFYKVTFKCDHNYIVIIWREITGIVSKMRVPAWNLKLYRLVYISGMRILVLVVYSYWLLILHMIVHFH